MVKSKLSAKEKIERLHAHTKSILMSIVNDYANRYAELLEELKKEQTYGNGTKE